MDINFEIEDYQFEWDSEKAEINFKKHKVRFETAVFAFLDENKIEYYDEAHSDFEYRYKLIGKVGKILVVIYTERENRSRIISARYANKDEQEDYYVSNFET